jgi:aminocarboxymuconate-semialdehyde decarboxylase
MKLEVIYLKIDIHSHFIPERFIERVKKDPNQFGIQVEQHEDLEYFNHKEGFKYPLSRTFYDVNAKLQDMETKKLDISVLSAPPTIFYYWSDIETAKLVCRTFNDSVSEFVRANPDRFAGMGIVPLQDTSEAVAELQRCHDELGLKAIEVGSHFEGLQYDDERFVPFFRKAEELDILLFFHPYYLGNRKGLESYYLTNILGNLIDTSVAISHIVFGGLLQRFPKLKLYFAHGGGFIPYQVGRLEHGHKVRGETKIHLALSPTKDVSKLIFDTITFNTDALQFLIQTQGEDHVVMGTDFPFDMGDVDPISHINSVTGLSPTQKRKIFGENAARLLNL